MFWLLIKRELKIAFRSFSELVNPLWFFLIVITLFPLSIGPEPQLLARISVGIFWVAAILSSLLSLERLFKDDYLDGSLEQLLLAPNPLFVTVLAKVIAHWLVTGLPLILLSPIAALMLSFNSDTLLVLAGTLLLGTPVLSFIGAIGAALTVSLKKGGVLVSLLVLPLYIPVLIYATGTMEAHSFNMPLNGYFAILAALFAASLTFSPLAIAAALKINISNS
ncbi:MULTISPECIES: heme exporter protein CcmB [Providencia]|uniref:Heme exporter protein B n=1 Tax=Providencia heimbachae ATCC 35613 TaxID=1354272 RepID=A0A1B7JPD9_9GAMM|nr:MULTISPECIES: heme exporter protein CcmB [Providencia]MBP6121974.1 heme exporter protein CcmB [Providencia sp.]MDD9338691.1 heme exporter protein CcmB [Providencia heimbachae]NIH21536.1 heme exporter protein CcmB [Providencia heimbachae]OAT49771.1 cytochrome c-type biogenesis protein [Providencia heimbachae ATCC 35613]QCJ69115.1 heme exporter protein CcmB [Providencia heimbachae]